VVGEKTVSVDEGRPFGETLMCFPVRGADAVKKTGCFKAQSLSSSERVS